ncbi:hypothetical protein ACFV1C_00330 [Streptomyces sp. NPDC059605]|uniref:hypothetical protein n=1 Tax=Streptomyces sp. NPDC059605 TaxID=3346882 RepID=UPI00367CBE8A
MQIPDRPTEGLFEMLANGTEYEVEIVDQPAQEVRRAYASVLATWLYGEEPKQAHRRESDARAALTARAEQAEAGLGRARALATQWAVLRTYGSAATELRAVLDEQPTTSAQRTDGSAGSEGPGR